MNGFPWELYNIDEDWTPADLAAKMPDKVRDMQRSAMQAEKYRVFPLDDSLLARFVGPKPSYTPDRILFTYAGELTNVPFPGVAGAANMLNKSYTITAEVEIPAAAPRACWSRTAAVLPATASTC